MMHCEGKCYLSLQLKKIESDYHESKAPFNPKNIKSTEFLLFAEKFASIAFERTASWRSSFMGGIYREHVESRFSNSTFHPPNNIPLNALTA